MGHLSALVAGDGALLSALGAGERVPVCFKGRGKSICVFWG